MGFEHLIPIIFFLAVLFLVLPEFLSLNSKSKIFFKNLVIWSIIVVSVVIVSTFIF
mgnify:FL=1